jgi:hypothetical protein
VWIIDWAWPTRGAAYIDAACFLIRAMAVGHSASQAEELAARCPGWSQAPPGAIDIFARASARLYEEIARDDPQPFKQRLADVAHDWSCHRGSTTSAAASMIFQRGQGRPKGSLPTSFASNGVSTVRTGNYYLKSK